MKKFFLRFCSKKFLVMLLVAIISYLGKTYKVPPEVIAWINGLIRTILGEKVGEKVVMELMRNV